MTRTISTLAVLTLPAGILATIWLWDWRWAATGLTVATVAKILAEAHQQKDKTTRKRPGTRRPVRRPDVMTSRARGGDPMGSPGGSGPIGPSPFGGGRG